MGDPDYVPIYKQAALRHGVEWKWVYAVDVVRYEFDLEKALPNNSVSLFYYYETIEVSDGEGGTKTRKVKRYYTLDEVMNGLQFTEEQKADVQEVLDSIIEEDYGSDHDDAIPVKIMELAKLAEKEYGVDWHILAGIWQWSNGRVTLPENEFIWKQYQADGNGDGIALVTTPEDVMFTIANYLSSNGHETRLKELLGYIFPGKENEVIKFIKDLQELKDIDNIHFEVWPVPGHFTITSGFVNRTNPVTGKNENHKGIDIGAPRNAAIIAVADGKVISTTETEYSGGYGNLTKIQHDGYQTWYAHQNKFAVAPGMIVSKGDLIGYVGRTGQSDGNHLHFEVRIGGKPVNPLPFLSKR